MEDTFHRLASSLSQVPEFADAQQLRNFLGLAFEGLPRGQALLANLRLSNTPIENAREIIQRCRGIGQGQNNALFRVLEHLINHTVLSDDVTASLSNAQNVLLPSPSPAHAFPPSPSPTPLSPRPLATALSVEWKNKVHQALLAADAYDHRSALISILTSEVRGALPRAKTPSAQLLSDIETLNRIALTGHSEPLRLWLQAAARLCRPYKESAAILDQAHSYLSRPTDP